MKGKDKVLMINKNSTCNEVVSKIREECRDAKNGDIVLMHYGNGYGFQITTDNDEFIN